MLAGFDAYRDNEARELMIEFVMRSRGMDKGRALDELRLLNHVGLAYVYRDALCATGQGHRIDYDPFEMGQ